jgi:hypothetical protein
VTLLTDLAETWRDRAACRGVGVDIFFPERGDFDYSVARDLCASCSVRVDCLDFALRSEPVAHGHRMGMWGGVLPAERRRMAKHLQRMQSCVECGEPFASSASNGLVCSAQCRKERNNRLDRELRARRRLGVAS